MTSENNKPTEYPSINLLKNLSKAQGLVRFVLENQRDNLLDSGSVQALDAIRDTIRALNTAHDDLNDLMKEHRDEKQNIIEQAFALK